MSRLWSRKQNRSLLRLQSIRTALLPAKQTKGKSLFARDTLSDIFKCSSCDSEVLMCRCAVEWTIQAKRQGPRLPQPKAFLLILSYFVTCLHQNSLMMLHQLGIQQAERETPAEAHISSLANTSMRPCTLFYIETRQTLPVQVETKMPDVVAAFSVHYRIIFLSSKASFVHFGSTLKAKASVWFWCLVRAHKPANRHCGAVIDTSCSSCEWWVQVVAPLCVGFRQFRFPDQLFW
jgi:hypothetical protein